MNPYESPTEEAAPSPPRTPGVKPGPTIPGKYVGFALVAIILVVGLAPLLALWAIFSF